MPRSSDARDRAVAATARLLQEQGYAGTGVSQILEVSGAPKGSFYFHFPGGKEQLTAEALHRSGAQVTAGIRHLAEPGIAPAELIGRFVDAETKLLVESGYRQGCPIATVALEMSSESDLIQAACQEIFATWVATLAEFFAPTLGDRAEEMAEHAIMSLEGALLLSRVRRDPGPLRRVKDRLRDELDRAAASFPS